MLISNIQCNIHVTWESELSSVNYRSSRQRVQSILSMLVCGFKSKLSSKIDILLINLNVLKTFTINKV